VGKAIRKEELRPKGQLSSIHLQVPDFSQLGVLLDSRRVNLLPLEVRRHLDLRDKGVGSVNSCRVRRNVFEVARWHVVHLREGVVLRIQLHVSFIPENEQKVRAEVSNFWHSELQKTI